MKHLSLKSHLFFFLSIMLLFPSNADNSAINKKQLNIFVSISPQAYFVEKIGGNRVKVEVLVSPGKSPATYSPGPSKISRLAKSDIYFRIGVPFENSLLPRIKSILKKTKIVDTAKGIQLRKMKSSHEHEKKHNHHGGNDPHIWLDPKLVKKQAKIILDALSESDPGGKAKYTKNHNLFCKELDDLDKWIKKILAPVKGKSIFVFHPSYGYFTDAYGLKQVAIEMEGKAPKGKDLVALIKMAKKNKIKTIFIQPQFNKAVAKKIAEAINGKVKILDPLAEDYMNNMKKITLSIAEEQ
jgi:zinc transport system substrate-binding protein